MTPPHAATRVRAAALSDDEDDDDYDSAVAGGGDALGSDPESQSQSQSEREGSRASLRRLQATLTAAMEHMEGAQLEFFHVQRTFAARRRRRSFASAAAADAEPSWSVRVRLYADFWSRFEAQLRAALAPGPETDRALSSLGAVARTVWGETRAPPVDAFRDGAVVLTPAAATEAAEPADDGARKKLKAARATATAAATAAASVTMERGKASPWGQRKQFFRTKEAAEAAAAREQAAADERRRRTRHLAGVSPHQSGAQLAVAADSASGAASPARKRKPASLKPFGGSSSDDDATSAPRTRVLAASELEDDAHDAAVGVTPANGAKPTQRKDEALARMRQRVRAQLVGDEVWPALRLPFPTHLLMFDAAAHAKLAGEHETFWRKNLAAFLDIVFSHPTQVERARLHQSKMRLLRRQRVLLTEYIETLGVEEVARHLAMPEARGAFFFVRKYISLEQLSARQLDEHLAHVHSPWTSPITQERQIPWWDVFTRKGARQEMIVDASDRVKREIADAHFRGALAFDATWTRLATQAPWKQMLAAARAPSDEEEAEAEQDAAAAREPPQSQSQSQSPPRKKAAGVAIKEEQLGAAASYKVYSPQRGLQEPIVMQFSSASDGSSSSDESDADDGGRQHPRSSLGKRLRTSSSSSSTANTAGAATTATRD